MKQFTVYGKSSNGKEATAKATFTKVEENKHYYVFYKNTSNWSEVTYDKIIFSNKGNYQSADLTLGSAGQLYDNGRWSDYYVTPKPTISTTLESGKISTATQVTYSVRDARQATYKVDDLEAVPFENEVTISVGEDLANGETQTVVIKAINGAVTFTKVYTYEMDSVMTPSPSVSPIVTPEPTITKVATVTVTPEPTGNITPEPTATNIPEASATPKPTAQPTTQPTSIPTVQPTEKITPAAEEKEIIALPEAKGESIIDEDTGVTYEVTKSDAKNGTVAYVEPDIDARGTVTVPESVTVNGITYKVTSIASNAFKSNKKITKVVIGKNVTTVGKNAFKGIYSKATIKVPKSKWKDYKAMLKSKGVGTKVKIKK